MTEAFGRPDVVLLIRKLPLVLNSTYLTSYLITKLTAS